MSSGGGRLENYVPVAERLADFHQAYPQTEFEQREAQRTNARRAGHARRKLCRTAQKSLTALFLQLEYLIAN